MAVKLNGSTQAMYTNTNISAFDALFTGAICVMGWMRPTSLAASVMVARQNGATIYETVLAGLSVVTANKVMAIFNTTATPANQQNIESATSITANVWTHWAIQYDSSLGSNRVSIWLNGVQDATGTTLSGNLTASTREITIGFNSDVPGTPVIQLPFPGDQDDIRFYNRALTANEMKTVYTCRGHDGIVNGLQARWMMNEGAPTASVTASSIKDSTAGARHMESLLATPVYVASSLQFRKSSSR